MLRSGMNDFCTDRRYLCQRGVLFPESRLSVRSIEPVGQGV